MDSKIIIINNEKQTKKVKTEKPKKKRIITQNNNWEEALKELEEIEEQNIEAIVENNRLRPVSKILLKQIKSKICGYAGQDRLKKLYNPEQFVNLQDVLHLFKTSEMTCYYCKEKTQLMYEYVREPKQWTLERMNNSFGHNRDNVVISCLSCNIRRRTMASEKYVLTKELGKIVKLDHD